MLSSKQLDKNINASTMTTMPSTDEEMRKLLKPACTPREIEEAVRSTFAATEDIAVKILQELDSYDDQNFVAELHGEKVLVKVHNGVESRDFLRSFHESGDEYDKCSSVIHLQSAIMKQLQSSGVCTSYPLPAKNGLPLAICSLPVVSEVHSPTTLVIKVLSWVPGRTMVSFPALPIEALYHAGIYLGQVDASLDKLDTTKHPSAHRFHAWDGKNTLELRNFVQYIDDANRRALVQSILQTFETEIINSGDCNKFRTGVLHGDYNDANILVNADTFQVAGAIDFGDSVASWRILDLTVGMAYALLTVFGKRGKSIAAAAAMLRGYHSIYPIQDLEKRHLHLLTACRLACSVTLGAYSLKQNPGNTYLLLHSQPAWNALELIWGYTAEHFSSMRSAFNQVFEQACQVGGNPACTDLDMPDPRFPDVLKSIRVKDLRTGQNKRTRLSDNGDKPVITFVTGNKEKLEEVQRILGDNLPFRITNEEVDLPELQGEPLEIAKAKCNEAASLIGGAVITEDTSLCFTALQGLPGPYIKWFLEKCGYAGLNGMIAAFQDKSAYAQTVVAFCPGPGQHVEVFDGRTMGKIVTARGKLEFGWDPVFEPDEGDGKTYAEMSKEEKDAISHRSRAMAQLKTYLTANSETVKLALV